MDRKPAVAGVFYTGNRNDLASQIDGFLGRAKAAWPLTRKAVAYVAPHAGYAYSGATAAYAYKSISMNSGLKDVDTFVVIGPNHTGMGRPVSVSATDWITPLGKVANDKEMSMEIVAQSGIAEIDEQAHRKEHSVEVQLPFLQRVVKKPACCFVCMGDQSMDSCTDISGAVLKSTKRLGRNTVVIASSDFNHYESAEVAMEKDMPAIKALNDMNPELFHRKIEELGDSACGFGPVTVAALFAMANGAEMGNLLKYSNSGEVTGDYGSVVAYASMAFW